MRAGIFDVEQLVVVAERLIAEHPQLLAGDVIDAIESAYGEVDRGGYCDEATADVVERLTRLRLSRRAALPESAA